MLIKIIRDTVADGKNVQASQEPIEVTDNNARTLILLGKAVPYEGKEAPAAPIISAPPPPVVEVKIDSPQAEVVETLAGGLEDVLEDDADLEPYQEGDELPSDYQALCEIAEEEGIENPAKIKKTKLIEMIKAKRAASAEAA